MIRETAAFHVFPSPHFNVVVNRTKNTIVLLSPHDVIGHSDVTEGLVAPVRAVVVAVADAGTVNASGKYLKGN